MTAQHHPNLHAYGLILRGPGPQLPLPAGEQLARPAALRAGARPRSPLRPQLRRDLAHVQRRVALRLDERSGGRAERGAQPRPACRQYDDLDARGYSEMGLAHLYKKEHDEALAAYERALQLNPNDADLLAEMGDCLVYVRQAERAVTAAASRRSGSILITPIPISGIWATPISISANMKRRSRRF